MLPRDLLTHLDDAESNIAGWTRAVVAAAEEARTASAVIENAVRAVGARVLQQRETVDALATKAAWLAQEAQRAAAIAAEACATAGSSEQSANSAAGEAIRAEQLWRGKLSEAETEQLAAVLDQSRAEAELGRAEAELSSARAREGAARQALAAAEAELRAAETELNLATGALESCQKSYATNSRGERVTPDCSQQEYRCQSALRAQRAASDHRVNASNELNAAAAAVANARRRVSLARDRVAELGQLVARARGAVSNAAEAVEVASIASVHAEEAAAAAARSNMQITNAAESLAGAEAASRSARNAADGLDGVANRFASLSARHVAASAAAIQSLTLAREKLWLCDDPTGLL
jgi:hypothetical protein